MPIGTIRRLVPDRGFGFIEPDDGGLDLFFHRSVVHRDLFDKLIEGREVDYETEPAPEPRPRFFKPRITFVQPRRREQVVEKSGCTQLSRHIRSRAKKPSWRR